MSEFVTLECKYCGNADRSLFEMRESECICKCCGRSYRESMAGGEMRSVMGFEMLKNYDFESAENVFTDIISEYPESVDARWGLLLARYGIVFVKGFYTGSIEPIYCFPNYSYAKGAFSDEPEYKEIEKLLKSDPERMALYRKQAGQIEAAFEAFRSDIGKRENDIFICVKISKTTAGNPYVKGTTEDYEKACELYGKLRGEGKRVFFSYVTLKNTVDSDMEIWRNLLKSKKMLLIGSRAEYLGSVWVKSEWERWLWLDNAGGDEHKKNLYIYILGNENENLYAKLPSGLRKLNPQIYTENNEADLVNDICYGDEPKKEKKPEKEKAPEKAPDQKLEKEQKIPKKPRGKDGYVEFLDGTREKIPFGSENAHMYYGRNDVVRAVLPKSVKSILGANFSSCANLESIDIPESVTMIAEGAFSGCSKLSSVKIPSGVAEISANTFYMCKNLRKVTLPAGLRKIDSGAFMLCESLRKIELPHTLWEIGDEAFHSSGLCEVSVPKAVIKIGERAFAVCKKLKRVLLYDTVAEIGADAFEHGAKIIYHGTKNGFGRANKAGTYYRKLVCRNDSSTKNRSAMTALSIFAILLTLATGGAVMHYVPGSFHWAIAIAGGIVLNIIAVRISSKFSDEVYVTVNGIELVASVLLFIPAVSYRTILIYCLGIAIGTLIGSLYLIAVRSEYGWIYCFLDVVGLVLAILGLIFGGDVVLGLIVLVAVLGFIGYIVWDIFDG